MGIRVASNMPYRGGRGVQLTMPDGKAYTISSKAALALSDSLYIASGGKSIAREIETLIGKTVRDLGKPRVASPAEIAAAKDRNDAALVRERWLQGFTEDQIAKEIRRTLKFVKDVLKP